LLWPEDTTRWQHFWMFQIYLGQLHRALGCLGAQTGAHPPCVQEDWEYWPGMLLSSGRAEGWLSGPIFSCFNKISLEPKWPLASGSTVVFWEAWLFGQMLCGGQGTLWCFRKHILLALVRAPCKISSILHGLAPKPALGLPPPLAPTSVPLICCEIMDSFCYENPSWFNLHMPFPLPSFLPSQ
jgi:hypothetical protein